MFIFSPQSNGDMFVEGFQKLFLQDFPQKIAFFILTPPALGAATWIKSRFDIDEKRKERVRRIADAAEVLRLRRELESLTDADRDWPTIQRLKPLVADFATTQLRRIEAELLKVDPTHRANSSTKGAFSRLLLLYVPVRPWLWIVHCVYYISIVIAAIAIFAFFANLPGKPDQVGAYIGSACFFFALGGAPLALPGSIANYFDAKFQGYVPTRRRNIFKRIGLMYRPASIWIWPFQVMF